MLPGSVSKYCLQHSPVPVIVVRPSSKRDKARSKRALDPNRHAYKDLLQKSGHILNTGSREFIAEESQPASDDEAAAVAAAIGYKPSAGASPLATAQTTPAEAETETVASSNAALTTTLDDLRSPGVVMKSPELGNLDSPDISDSSSSDEEGGVPTGAETAESGAADAKGTEPGAATAEPTIQAEAEPKETESLPSIGKSPEAT